MPELQLTKLLNLPNLEIIKYEMPNAETAVLEIRSRPEAAICPTCKRRAFGYINFDHFRLRILVECAPDPT
jgi:transposase